ncbi:MAG TPA: superoxide dismutase [Myxococcota bacterium]|nr:superoxide dismutase [Myxococcota bacterium]
MDFKLKPLPYAYDALEPHIGAETVETHYEKHHRGYMEKLEKLLSGQPAAERSLEQLIREQSGPIFDNAAQVWNHDFYWRSLRPGAERGGQKPRRGPLAERIVASFGSVDGLCRQLEDAADKLFGSGYAWLFWRPGAERLEVAGLPDADNPLLTADVPLLCIDVWEHAYYLDRRNRRDEYVSGVIHDLLDWEAAERRLRDAV